MPLSSTLLGLLVTLLWGINFVVIKWGVADFPPFLFAAMRFVVAAVPAIFFVGKPCVPTRTLLVFGVLTGVLYFGFLFLGMKLGMPAGLSSIVIQSQTFFTIAFSAVLLKDYPKPLQILGVSVAFGGLILISKDVKASEWFPFLLVFMGAIFWGLSNVVLKAAAPRDMLNFIAWASLVPPLPLLILSLVFEGKEAIGASLAHPSARGIFALFYIGWLATTLGYALWGKLLRQHSATLVAPFSLLIPLVGIASGCLLLDESFSIIQVLGAALIVSGLAINSFGARVKVTHP